MYEHFKQHGVYTLCNGVRLSDVSREVTPEEGGTIGKGFAAC